MNRLKTFFLGLVRIAIWAGLAALIGWVVYSFFQYLNSVPKELGAALVAAAATILVATVTVMVGRYYERQKELDALFREKKTEIYDDFLKEFFTLFWSAGETDTAETERDLVPFLREFTRKLMLWSGPEVIEAFVAWKDHLAKGTPDAKSIFLTEAFLLAIRRDLRHSNKGLRKGFFARLFLREGELFLAMAAKNPDVTLATLNEAENALKLHRLKVEGG